MMDADLRGIGMEAVVTGRARLLLYSMARQREETAKNSK
jgi:hypothetical protein